MIQEVREIFSEGKIHRVIDSSISFSLLLLQSRGICNINHLDEEHTHRISIDLDDNAGVIDLFVTISGIPPLMDAMNESDTASNLTIDVIPSKLTDEDVNNYVSIKQDQIDDDQPQ